MPPHPLFHASLGGQVPLLWDDPYLDFQSVRFFVIFLQMFVSGVSIVEKYLM